MELFKYDIHVHTDEVSPCGKIEAEKMVKLYKKAGYAGVVITDHFRSRFFTDINTGISHEEKVDRYLLGYRKAKKLGDKMGIKIFWGLEITFPENSNDYLVYGINEEILNKYRNITEIGLAEFYKLMKKINEDILIFQAHPFRTGTTIMDPELLDGIEIYNGNPRHDSRNELALKFAQRHGLRKISGSDFHQLEDLGQGGIILPEKPETEADLVQMLKKEKIRNLLTTV
ncbi:MAG: PHP domain-containing protein [Bacillota bacterium]